MDLPICLLVLILYIYVCNMYCVYIYIYYIYISLSRYCSNLSWVSCHFSMLAVPGLPWRPWHGPRSPRGHRRNRQRARLRVQTCGDLRQFLAIAVGKSPVIGTLSSDIVGNHLVYSISGSTNIAGFVWR